jgi:hypothetical protein
MYQPDLGRFFTQDRFAEKYYSMPPYQYAFNNPIRCKHPTKYIFSEGLPMFCFVKKANYEAHIGTNAIGYQ